MSSETYTFDEVELASSPSLMHTVTLVAEFHIRDDSFSHEFGTEILESLELDSICIESAEGYDADGQEVFVFSKATQDEQAKFEKEVFSLLSEKIEERLNDDWSSGAISTEPDWDDQDD